MRRRGNRLKPRAALTVTLLYALLRREFQRLERRDAQMQEAQAALGESQEKFRNLIENTSDWVWEINELGVYTYCSPRIHEILGYAPEEVLGKTPFDLMPSEEAKRVAELFAPISG